MPEKISFAGWPNCYRLTNGALEVIITGDVGPRILSAKPTGGENVLLVNQAPEALTAESWIDHGGHRLWHAPEDPERTYVPDNEPVEIEDHGVFVRARQAVEKTTGICKELDLILDETEPRITLKHRLTNTNLWAVRLAPWAISVMSPGGVAVIPLPPRGSHPENLIPTSTVALWAYTDMGDPRWTWGRRYVLLRQDSAESAPQKAGFAVPDGWAGYVLGDQFFLKTFSYDANAPYPDLGSSVEIFTNQEMLELETLGPLVEIAPGASVEHVEHWHLFTGVSTPSSEADVEAELLPLVQNVLW
ncbi:MAG: DUF2170 family protein [Trueperaceae bacterium]|nr:MAG: DUF2170 family protein [Trueperaceae bacterium]